MTRWKQRKRRRNREGWDQNSERSSISSSYERGIEPTRVGTELKILEREFWPRGSKLDREVWSRGLPDDVYCTILAHLPMSSLYQLRAVCKSWSLMPNDKSFLEACSRVRPRTPSLLLMDKDCCWTYEPAMNEWKRIPLSFFLPQDSEMPTFVVSSAGGRILLLRRCRLLLHNPLNNSLKLLPPMLDMEHTDLPTFFDVHISGMFVNYCGGDTIDILVMNKMTNFDEEVDNDIDYDISEPISSQMYDSRDDSWKLLMDFDPLRRLSIASAAMFEAKLQVLVSSCNHHSNCKFTDLAMYSVLPNAWEKENIRMPDEGQKLVAPHLFTFRGALMLVAALPTNETRNDRFPTWNKVTVWELSRTVSASSIPRRPDGYWNRVFEIGSRELNAEVWNTSLDSFFFLSGGDFIYFGSRSGSSLGMISLKTQTWRLLPSFPGITSHFGAAIHRMNLQTFLFEPRFDLVV